MGQMRDHTQNELLTALFEAWLSNETVADIGSDPEKVRLLKRVAEEEGGNQPTPFVRDIYERVFLRDIWKRISA